MPSSLKTVNILANFGFEAQVIDESGKQYRCIVKKSLGRLVVGDQIQAELINDELRLLKALPRKSLLTRQTGKTLNTQLSIASNLDDMIIVCSPLPAMNMVFFDAMIIAATQQQIEPILLLNKSDLPEFALWQQQMREYYHHTSFEMLEICALEPNTFTRLKQKISHKKSLFIGASGVGKSTLLNSLLGKKYAKTQQLSTHSQQGKHTTSNSICYYMDSSTQIIDMPGIRTFNLSSYDNIERAYPELNNYLGKCQFRNCQHRSEPHCAIQEAIINQEISAERVENYLYFKEFSHL